MSQEAVPVERYTRSVVQDDSWQEPGDRESQTGRRRHSSFITQFHNRRQHSFHINVHTIGILNPSFWTMWEKKSPISMQQQHYFITEWQELLVDQPLGVQRVLCRVLSFPEKSSRRASV